MIAPSTAPLPQISQASVEDAELAAVMEGCLAAIEAGQPLDPVRLAADHPAVADRLRSCLASLRLVEQAAGKLTADPTGESPPLLGCLGDFRLLREVGRGGMGIVYEAEQVSLNRRVALKVLPFAATLDPRQLQRFKHEAQAAGHLHHTHIVPVHAVGCERGVHYYAMQFIEGQTLASVIAELRRQEGRAGTEAEPSASTVPQALFSTQPSVRSPAFSRTVARFGLQAAEALEHAHDMGVVHRDIKPANLLVDAQGKLWVTDFGLALCQAGVGLTMTGDLVGTLRYMSPEQAMGRHGLVDHRTDIYSLGLTLYELLTLEAAFPGRDRQDVLRQIAFQEPQLPRRLNRMIPVELETIVLKAMAKEPLERYETAQQLADDLTRFLADRPIRASRPSLWRLRRKWTDRHRSLVGMVLGMLVLAVLWLSVGIWQITLSRNEMVYQRGLAEAHAKLSEERERALRRHLYPADINAAYRESQIPNRERARLLLSKYLPVEADKDLRGFEWYYLWAKCRPVETRTLSGSYGTIFALAFSPDGAILASAGSARKTIQVWDPNTGQLLDDLSGHDARVNKIMFTPDGKTMASLSSDGTVRLWDLKTRRSTTKIARSEGMVIGPFYPGNGARIAGVVTNGWLELWNLDSDWKCTLQRVPHGKETSAAAASLDGKSLAFGDETGRVNVWSIETGAHLASLDLPTRASSMAFSPDGRLAIGCWDALTYLWRIGARQPEMVYKGHLTRVLSLAFSSEGSLLASGSEDNQVRTWHAASGLTREVLSHGARVFSVAIAPGNRVLASGGEDGLVKLHQLQQAAPPVTLQGSLPRIQRLRVSVNGESVAAWDHIAGADTLMIWHQGIVRERRVISSNSGRTASCIAFSPNGALLAGVRKNAVRLWNATTGVIGSDTFPGRCAAFSPDGRTIATGDGEGAIRLFDVATSTQLLEFSDRQPEVWSVAFSPDGRILASGHGNEQFCLWNTSTGRLTASLRRLRGPAVHLDFSPKGEILAVASHCESTIELWDLSKRDRTMTITGPFWGVNDMGFSPDGRTLAVGAAQRVFFYHPTTGQEFFALDVQGSFVPSINFSPDGESLIPGAAPIYGTTGDPAELITWHAPRGDAQGNMQVAK